MLTHATELGFSREHLILSGALPTNVDKDIISNMAVPLGGAIFESLNESKSKTLSILGRYSTF